MKIICTDNRYSKTRGTWALTVGKFYKIEDTITHQIKYKLDYSIIKDSYFIRNDINVITWYPKNCFTTPEQAMIKMNKNKPL